MRDRSAIFVENHKGTTFGKKFSPPPGKILATLLCTFDTETFHFKLREISPVDPISPSCGSKSLSEDGPAGYLAHFYV